MVNWENVLREKLYRFDCPEPSLLRDYAWNYLSVLETRRVKNHLKKCPLCSAELVELKVAIEQPASMTEKIEELVKKVKVVIAQLIPDSAESAAMRPAFRGGNEDRTFWYMAEETVINVSWQQNEFGRFTILGQALAAESASSYAGLELKTDPDHSYQTQLDENGVFSFFDIEGGTYQLTLELPEQSILVSPILIGN